MVLDEKAIRRVGIKEWLRGCNIKDLYHKSVDLCMLDWSLNAGGAIAGTPQK